VAAALVAVLIVLVAVTFAPSAWDTPAVTLAAVVAALILCIAEVAFFIHDIRHRVLDQRAKNAPEQNNRHPS
jgi:fatty acid desaturase